MRKIFSPLNGLNSPFERRPFLPRELFALDQDGAIWPAYDTTAVFTTDTGSTLATPGEDVGRIEDQTANGNDLTQSNSALRGTLVEVDGNRAVRFDLVDDTAVSGAFADGLTGQVLVAGFGGQYVEDVTIAAAGTFTLGPNSWTGGTPGILDAVHGVTDGAFVGAPLREGTFTDAEIDRLERFYKRQGAKGLLVPDGVELMTNGTFDTDLSDWYRNPSYDADAVWVAGEMEVTAVDNFGRWSQNISLDLDKPYLLSGAVEHVSGSKSYIAIGFAGNGDDLIALPQVSVSGAVSTAACVFFPEDTDVRIHLVSSLSGTVSKFDNISVQKLTPREDL